MNVPSMIAHLVLGVGVPLCAIVTFLMWNSSRKAPHIAVLRERYITAIVVTLNVIVFGLIFHNNDQLEPWISTDATKIITRLLMLALAIIPASAWLWWNIFHRK